jgi:hypothetical protein
LNQACLNGTGVILSSHYRFSKHTLKVIGDFTELYLFLLGIVDSHLKLCTLLLLGMCLHISAICLGLVSPFAFVFAWAVNITGLKSISDVLSFCCASVAKMRVSFIFMHLHVFLAWICFSLLSFVHWPFYGQLVQLGQRKKENIWKLYLAYLVFLSSFPSTTHWSWFLSFFPFPFPFLFLFVLLVR